MEPFMYHVVKAYIIRGGLNFSYEKSMVIAISSNMSLDPSNNCPYCYVTVDGKSEYS